MHYSCTIRLHDLQSRQLYSPVYVYSQSKLALIMFTYRFNEWIEKNMDSNNENGEKYLTINSLHPGVCRSDMIKRAIWLNVPSFIINMLTRVSRFDFFS